MIVIAALCALCQTKFTAVSSSESKRGVQCMSWSGLGVWLAAQGSFRVLLFHASTYDQLLEINVGPAVAQKLQSMPPASEFLPSFGLLQLHCVHEKNDPLSMFKNLQN